MKYEVRMNGNMETVNSLPEAINLVKDSGIEIPAWYEKQIYKRDEDHPEGGLVGRTDPFYSIEKVM